MRSIWKFPLELAEQMRVPMPAGARIIDARLDAAGVPCLWPEVDTEAPLRDRRLRSVGTGGWLPDGIGPHIATLLTDVDGDEYVFHLYDEPQHEPVTGLLSAEALAQRLGGVPAGSGAASVIVVDLDGLKRITDEHGQHASETLLMETGVRIRSVLAGRCDAAAARVGGDEFAVLLTGAGLRDARELAERLLRELARPHPFGPAGTVVTASAGVASFRAGEPSGPALRAAEEALQEAKAAGGGQLATRWRP